MTSLGSLAPDVVLIAVPDALTGGCQSIRDCNQHYCTSGARLVYANTSFQKMAKRNYKSELNELLMKEKPENGSQAEYHPKRNPGAGGADHLPSFISDVRIGSLTFTSDSPSPSKKGADQLAAKKALQYFTGHDYETTMSPERQPPSSDVQYNSPVQSPISPDCREQDDSQVRQMLASSLESALSKSHVEQNSDWDDDLKIDAKDLIVTEKRLGSGSFADVYVACWRTLSVAVKVFKKDITASHRSAILREISLYKILHHPNIASVCGAVSEGPDTAIQLVTELYQGSVHDVIEAGKEKNSEDFLALREKVDLVIDILRGIDYLHNHKPTAILHGDIRPTNVLVTRMMVAKIGDLGTARPVDDDLSVGLVSPQYKAPERVYQLKGNTKLADMFSVGVTVIQIFSGFRPPSGQEDRKMHLKLVSPKTVQHLCKMLTDHVPEKRQSAMEALTQAMMPLQETDSDYCKCPPRRLVKRKDRGDGVELQDKLCSE